MRTSVIVAVKDAGDALTRVVERLAPFASPDTEVIFVVAGAVPQALGGADVRHRVIVAAPETLIPLLWRDGIAAATGERVALTTAQCIPRPDWVSRIAAADLTRWSGVGGAIANDPRASALNWAIYFLRYSHYMPDDRAGVRSEIAADNAVYDRAAIMRHPDLLAKGFWEPSFHARFRAEGRPLYFDPAMIVEHHGSVSFANFMRQRHAHGREFGQARAAAATSWGKLALVAAGPLVPAVILARIARRAVREWRHVRPFAASLPTLTALVGAWSLGEARGYVEAGFRNARSGSLQERQHQ